LTHYRDLESCDYFGQSSAGVLSAVGWLDGRHPFPVGGVKSEFYVKLKELLSEPWQPTMSCGVHSCEICQFDGPSGLRNLFVPGLKTLYVCPELILHYIAAHQYLPPERFIQAVAECPLTNTMEYKRRLLACGGGVLLRANDSELG